MKYILYIILICLSGPLKSQQAYYVSKTGDNTHDGSDQSPWQTIQFGMDQLQPGDTLFIGEGTYFVNLRLNNSGSKIAPILIMPHKRATVSIIGENGLDVPSLTIAEQKHVIIDGLIFRDNEKAAAILVDRSTDIQIRRNQVHNNRYGIQLMNSNIPLPVEKIKIINNTIFRNAGFGLQIGPEDPDASSGLLSNITVRNNSFYENDMDQSDQGEILVSNCQDCSILNNIFYMNEQALLGEIHVFFYRVTLDFNDYYSLTGQDLMRVYWDAMALQGFSKFLEASTQESNGLFTNPLFLDVSDDVPDLHLIPNSPLIGKGDPDANYIPGELDMDGQTRVHNLPDIGADEYYLQLIVCSLGQFYAEVVENGVQLSWTGTCFSENGGRFEIMRSLDKSEWETIGLVESREEDFNIEINYEYLDPDPPKGYVFYRTRFVDDNGSFILSNTDQVDNLYTSEEYILIPNPFSNAFVISSKYEMPPHTTNIYDVRGVKIPPIGYDYEFRPHSSFIDLSDFKPGLYFVELVGMDGQVIHRQSVIKHGY